MNLENKNYFKTISIILIVFFVLWGLFYFLSKDEKALVSENKASLEKNTENSLENQENINDEMFENEEIAVTEEIEINEEVKKNQDAKIPEKDTNKQDVSKNIAIIEKLVSWGFTPSSGRSIDTVILHSSYDALGDEEYDVDGLIAEYKEYGVAAHYLIDRNGHIYRLVEEKDIAYHAGASKTPDGRSNVNNFSLGIEIMNTKTDDYEKAQYDAINELIKEIKKNHNIKYILGHDEIAPERKTDPWNMDWSKIDR